MFKMKLEEIGKIPAKNNFDFYSNRENSQTITPNI